MRSGKRGFVVRALSTTLLCVLLAACSSDGSGDAGANSDQTTTLDRSEQPAFAEPGPYPVGVRTFPLGTDGAKVDVWYPTTDEAATGTTPVVYRLSDWLPPTLQARVSEDVDAFATNAHRDVAPSNDGPFPLVLFSHGFASYRDQSTFLTTHLASWGIVVASPDHLSRGLLSILGGGTPDPDAAIEDMHATVALLRNTVTEPGGPLEGTIDYDRVATAGHSAGSDTAIRTAGDPELGVEVDAYIAMSAGESRTNPARTPLPDVPSVFMAGSVDATVAPSDSQRRYERAPTPKRYYEYAKSGHLVFTDICQIGKEQGGVLALASTFGIEVPERLQRLAGDGCQATALPTPKVWPAIRHFTVANLRAVWGIDDPPVGLAAVDAFDGVEITTESSS